MQQFDGFVAALRLQQRPIGVTEQIAQRQAVGFEGSHSEHGNHFVRLRGFRRCVGRIVQGGDSSPGDRMPASCVLVQV